MCIDNLTILLHFLSFVMKHSFHFILHVNNICGHENMEQLGVVKMFYTSNSWQPF